MIEMRMEEEHDENRLEHGVEIVWKEPVKKDLAAGERAGEEKLGVGRIKGESSLEKAAADRSREHEESAAKHGLPFEESAKKFRLAVIMDQSQKSQRRHPAQKLGGPPQLPEEA